jgi:hypothetical protein
MENNTLIQQILDIVLSLFNQNKPAVIQAVQEAAVGEVQKSVQEVAIQETPGIDWTNPACKVSKYFTVKEMIFLPSWNRMANEADGLNDQVKANLIDLAKCMDVVRETFGKPINVHVTYRPLEYNKAIKGALHSAHTDGAAMDFDIAGMNCDDARKQINDQGLLDQWRMRMEDMPGGNWVHLDRRQPPAGGHRFFKP